MILLVSIPHLQKVTRLSPRSKRKVRLSRTPADAEVKDSLQQQPFHLERLLAGPADKTAVCLDSETGDGWVVLVGIHPEDLHMKQDNGEAFFRTLSFSSLLGEGV